MKILFVHQGFPGQYVHLLHQLARSSGNQLCGLGMAPRNPSLPKNVAYFRYGVKRGNTKGLDPLLVETESKLIRAHACASVAHKLKAEGFQPDLICTHPGWGESLFLKDVWPHSPLLCYQEFFYNAIDSDFDFDPTQQGTKTWLDNAKVRMKNANVLLNLDASDWGVTPTAFQRSTFPQQWQSRISIIHDGINTSIASPDPNVAPLQLPDGTELRRGDPIVTFVNRNLEPYRGCHILLRAIPALQELAPDARLVVVGETKGVSYGKACPTGSWRDVFLKEIEGRYDPSRVHFTGPLPYPSFLQLLKITAVHVYLTYPFVLSWSLLEAMSSGCAVVGSATAPVKEVIRDGIDGVLVDFFSPSELAQAVADLLTDPRRAALLGAEARRTVVNHYSFEKCLPQHLALMQLTASGALAGSRTPSFP